MPELNDRDLLRQHGQADWESAFAQIVSRHIDLVYSIAQRQVGSREDAQDITQAVFILLAKKAAGLRQRATLTGWLYETTRFTGLRLLRTRARRHLHEREAAMQMVPDDPSTEAVWDRLSPLLEEGVSRLNEKERTLLALRYYENQSIAETARLLGIGEWAARKRAERTLEKLRLFFAKRGVALSTASLSAAVSAHSVQAAPAGLAAVTTAAAFAKGAAAGGSALTLTKGVITFMAWSKIKTGAVSAVVMGCLLVPLVVQRQAQAKLNAQDVLFRQQQDQIASRQAENERLSAIAANSSLSESQSAELQKLRAEMPALQQQTREVARLREENRRLKQSVAKPMTPVQLKEEAMAKAYYGKSWVIAFYHFAEKHQGRFPTSFDEASGLGPKPPPNHPTIGADQFEIVFQGSLKSVKKPQETIVLREKEAWNSGQTSNPPGQWAKIYAFADGHSEIHQEPENNFDDYEKAHTVSPAADTPPESQQ